MDNKSKVISGLRDGKFIIQKPNKYFTDSEKHHIIQEFLNSGSTKNEIWKKFTGQELEHGQLLRWMRKLGYSDFPESGIPIFIAENDILMSKKKDTIDKHPEDLEIHQLKKRIAELESKLKDSEIKAILFSTMVDVAEKEFNIPIRKKYNTKSLKK